MKILKNKLFHIISFFFGVKGTRYSVLGDFFDSIRVALLKFSGAKIGKNTYLRSNLFITNPRLLKIGDNSGIGRNASLFLYKNLSIGSNVQIGSSLTVHTAEHILDQNFQKPLIKRGVKYNKVIIGNNVYIGSNVTILQGVKIGDSTVIGAGSVVLDSLQGGFLYAGVPAIKKRRIK